MADQIQANSEFNQSVDQSLVSPYRAEIMRRLVSTAFTKKIRALEIGTWFGSGSTRIWLESLPDNSELTLIDSWIPYSSNADKDLDGTYASKWDYIKMDSQSNDALLSTISIIKKFESEQNNKKVSLIRSSSTFLQLLKDDIFDFIFIDGDHKYETVKKDIIEAKRLANKKFSIICGDDLEKVPTENLLEISRNYLDRDYLGGEYGFHPGVCLAVSEELGEVNMSNGFWWVTYKKGSLTNNYLRNEQLKY